jgi:hydroxymethylpyrimidine/phosphomethylpyrimidine kinase
MKEGAKRIFETGAGAIVMKGGHLPGEPVDLLYDGKDFLTWKKERIDREVHGTGCMFSSLLISFLVQDYPLKEAFLASEKRMEELIRESYRIDETGVFLCIVA